ncbi:hypothetical protein ACVXG7_13755 [Enterobacter hormaechei]
MWLDALVDHHGAQECINAMDADKKQDADDKKAGLPDGVTVLETWF